MNNSNLHSTSRRPSGGYPPTILPPRPAIQPAPCSAAVLPSYLQESLPLMGCFNSGDYRVPSTNEILNNTGLHPIREIQEEPGRPRDANSFSARENYRQNHRPSISIGTWDPVHDNTRDWRFNRLQPSVGPNSQNAFGGFTQVTSPFAGLSVHESVSDSCSSSLGSISNHSQGSGLQSYRDSRSASVRTMFNDRSLAASSGTSSTPAWRVPLDSRGSRPQIHPISNHPNTASENIVAGIFNGRSDGAPAFQPAQIILELRKSNLETRSRFGSSPLSERTGPVTIPYHENPNYMGHSAGGNQAPWLDERLNCAVWIMDIHPQAGVSDLLNSIRNCGRIFSCWLNEAQPPQHLNGASKTVFTTRRGFDNFMARVNSLEGLRIFGKRVNAVPNRTKYRETPNQTHSRVIGIYGPAIYVNRAVLDGYFSQLFYYHTCDVVEGSVDADGRRYLVWYFGSILSQSQAAKKAIESEPELKNILTVTYLPDPCE